MDIACTIEMMRAGELCQNLPGDLQLCFDSFSCRHVLPRNDDDAGEVLLEVDGDQAPVGRPFHLGFDLFKLARDSLKYLQCAAGHVHLAAHVADHHGQGRRGHLFRILAGSGVTRHLVICNQIEEGVVIEGDLPFLRLVVPAQCRLGGSSSSVDLDSGSEVGL